MEGLLLTSISKNVNEIKESYSEIQDTTEYKQLRVQAIRDWPRNKPFDVENEFLNRVNKLPITFIPFQFHYLEENTYNLLLSLFLDTLDFLPMRPDLSFDFIWRAIDTYSSEVFPNLKSKEALQKCIKEVWTPALTEDVDLLKAFNSLFTSIPVQSCEYLYKRLYQSFDINEALTKQSQLIGRLIEFDGGAIQNQKIAILLAEIYYKFNYNPQEFRKIREGSRLLYRLFGCKNTCDDKCSDECKGKCGGISFEKSENESEFDVNLKREDKITINIRSERSYKIELEDKLNFLINGILYTFRNDKAHGAVFSPFRSSKASIKTYAHSNFCFLAAYILLLILMGRNDEYKISNKDVVENITKNIDLFQKLYGRVLKA